MNNIIISIFIIGASFSLLSQTTTTMDADGSILLRESNDFTSLKLHTSGFDFRYINNNITNSLKLKGDGSAWWQFSDPNGIKGIELFANGNTSTNTHGNITLHGYSLGTTTDGPFIKSIYLVNQQNVALSCNTNSVPTVTADYFALGFYNRIGTGSWTHLGFYSSSSNGIVSKITQSGDYLQLSDSRLKTNIENLEDTYQDVLKLNPVTYNVNNHTDLSYGFLAQELKEIFPEMVSHIKNDHEDQYMVNYHQLIPILTAAIQEQHDVLQKQKEQRLQNEKELDKIEKKAVALGYKKS